MQGALRTGQMLKGKYRLEALLGSGGMGDVYRASNVLVDRTVAIKALHQHHSKNEELVGRFMREARAANAVRHRHIVDVLDIDRDERGIPFIVQEYLEGEDLAARLERPPHLIAPAEALQILLPIIEALGVAHKKGIVHRDLKPDNVFLARVDGEVVPKILDFGISKIDVEEEIRRSQPAGSSQPPTPMSHRLTAAGASMGTPAYMSPEQIRDPRSVDARTDVWAVGVMLYEVLSGKMPFDAEDLAGLFVAIQTVDPPALDRIAPAVPKALSRVVHRCLSPEPSGRYDNASELAAGLRGYCERAAQARQDATKGRAPSDSLLPADVVALSSSPPEGSDPPPTSGSRSRPAAKPATPNPFELELDLAPPPVSNRPRPSSPRPPTSSAPSLPQASGIDFDDDDPLEGRLDVDLAVPVPTSQRPAPKPAGASGHRAALTANRPESDRGINVRRRSASGPAVIMPALGWMACILIVAAIAVGAPYLSPAGVGRARATLGPLTWQVYAAGAAVSVLAMIGVASAGIRRISYALFLAAIGLTAISAAAIAATGILAAPGLLPPVFRKLSLFGAPWAAIATLAGLALFFFDRGRTLRREEGAPIFGWWLTLSSLICLAAAGWLGVRGPRASLQDISAMTLVPAEPRTRKHLADLAVVSAGARALDN